MIGGNPAKESNGSHLLGIPAILLGSSRTGEAAVKGLEALLSPGGSYGIEACTGWGA
ncbi:hypothetical protein ACFMBG_19540 [Leisingera sp. D0M16]|uniref:hypothetical protein n=1 Tax=Leisingera coralii TaxID=3351347 RepID=UPI003B811521